MSAPFTTPAILLRAIAYGESDRVVTLLGRGTGRVSALAKGARKSMRRFGGGLGMGATGVATLRERPGAELAWLESFDVHAPRLALAADLARAAHAAYALELCEKLCGSRQPEPAAFDWLEELLARLEAEPATAERLRVFELGLLERVGVGPSLQACVSCGRAELGDETVRWQPERGGVVCQVCERQGALLPPATRRALVRLSRLSLPAARDERLGRDLNASCRHAILELLRFHIPGQLKSLEFILKVGGSSP